MAIITPHTTRAPGTVLTASIYNADHVNHVNNANALNLNAGLFNDSIIITGTGKVFALNETSTGASAFVMRLAGVDKAYIGVASAVNNLVTGSAIDDLVLRTQGGKVLFSLDSGATVRLALDTALKPGANDGVALGTTILAFSDLFLASGGVINWNNGDVTATHLANTLSFAGAASGYKFDANLHVTGANAATATNLVISWEAAGGDIQSYSSLPLFLNRQGNNVVIGDTIRPVANDGAQLGTAVFSFADLFLASGAVINFNNGNVILTHSAASLVISGATVFNLGTSCVFTVGSIELGAAADTSLSRSAAGRLAVEGVNALLTSSTDTVTNKRNQPRLSSAASGDVSPDVSVADIYIRTALSATTAINSPGGTPVGGEKLLFRLKDNGTSRVLNWNAIFRAVGVTIPASTSISKITYVGAIYNSDDTKWDVVAVTTEV